MRTKLVKLITIRAAILFIILSTLDMLLLEQRWHVFAGLLAGGIFSIMKLYSTSGVLADIAAEVNKKAVLSSILRYVMNLAATALLLIAGIMVSVWLFAGVSAGILLVPVVMLVNAFTEGLGIINNKFER